MATRFPSRKLLRCAGCSMILSHILLLWATTLLSIDYNHYTVESEEDVVELHDSLSSSKHRTEVEIAVGMIWFAFPLLLIGIYGIFRAFYSLQQGTSGEIWIWVAEKSWIVWMIIAMIIIPALSLASVSYDWSFYEASVPETVPAGYYIQLFLSMYTMELIDCMSVADAVVMVSIMIAGRLIFLDARRGNQKLQKFIDIIQPTFCKKISCCCEAGIILFGIVMFILYIVLLFEFAESGFFSPTGYGKILIFITFLFKIMLGVRFAYVSTNAEIYNGVVNLLNEFDDENKPDGGSTENIQDDHNNDKDNKNTTGGWEMDTINVENVVDEP